MMPDIMKLPLGVRTTEKVYAHRFDCYIVQAAFRLQGRAGAHRQAKWAAGLTPPLVATLPKWTPAGCMRRRGRYCRQQFSVDCAG